MHDNGMRNMGPKLTLTRVANRGTPIGTLASEGAGFIDTRCSSGADVVTGGAFVNVNAVGNATCKFARQPETLGTGTAAFKTTRQVDTGLIAAAVGITPFAFINVYRIGRGDS